MKTRVSAIVAASLTLLVSCGGGSSSDGTAQVDGGEIGIDLTSVCPSTVVIQTDWNPEAEHGVLYQMLGPSYQIDAARLRVSGELYAGGKRTGVKIEIRSGGPAIGYGQVSAELYQSPEILLGFVGTGEAISHSVDLPTLGVVAPFNISPQIIMWDPETYPDVKTIADLKEPGIKVRYLDGVTFMEYLVQSGILSASQVDATYDGTAAAFIASGGKDAQQGFGTSEPYFYENVLSDWKRPVAYQYVHETGWTSYAQSLAATPENVARYDSCLRKLVPIIQQAQIDFLRAPDRANAIILDAVSRFNNGWVYDAGQAAAAVTQMAKDGIVANSPDGVLGSFDMDRVVKFIETATPVFRKSGTKLKKGLTPQDLVTNAYIDASISL